jgi:hypothetical protein
MTINKRSSSPADAALTFTACPAGGTTPMCRDVRDWSTVAV